MKQIKPSNSLKILVFHSWGIGDLVMATPMLQSLTDSEHEVDLCLTSSAPQALLREHEIVQKVYICSTKISLLAFILSKCGHYDALVVTSGTNMQKAGVLALLLKAKVYAKSINKNIHRIYDNLENVASLLETKIHTPQIALPSEEAFQHAYLHPSKPNIALAVGSGKNQTFKRWPFEHFLELSKKLEGSGVQTLFIIGPDEPELLEKAEQAKCTVVKESLSQTALLISKLDLLIGNDNGLMHLGYATAVETLTIFGMTDEKIIGGYDAKRNHTFALELKCRPCFNSEVGRIQCQDTICLSHIKPQQIYHKAMQLLQGSL